MSAPSLRVPDVKPGRTARAATNAGVILTSKRSVDRNDLDDLVASDGALKLGCSADGEVDLRFQVGDDISDLDRSLLIEAVRQFIDSIYQIGRDRGLRTVGDIRVVKHENSPMGYGAASTAPAASADAPTSADGDTIGVAADTSSPPG